MSTMAPRVDLVDSRFGFTTLTADWDAALRRCDGANVFFTHGRLSGADLRDSCVLGSCGWGGTFDSGFSRSPAQRPWRADRVRKLVLLATGLWDETRNFRGSAPLARPAPWLRSWWKAATN